MKKIGLWIGLILLAAGSARTQPDLRLKARATPARRGIRPTAAGATHLILQFERYPDAGIRSELESRGIRVLEYVPDNALLVAAAGADLGGLPVEWSGALETADKISPQLDQQTAGPLLVEFYSDVPPDVARSVVVELGFDVIENPSVLPGQLVVTGAHSDIGNLAARDEVKYILPAAPELAAGEPMAGCSGAVAEAGLIGDYVLVGTGWPKDQSGRVALTYFVRSLTEKLDPSVARSEVDRALHEWTKYANLTISTGQQESGLRAVDILFARGAHGDAYPFDGPGGVLAHTFYPSPPNSEPIAGDIHLDADEAWATGKSVDLFSVALHEAGHALGLGHSDRPGAVMYPYYKLSAGLADDDIAAIQALYGKPGGSSASGPSPTPAPTPTPTPPPAPAPPPTPTPSGPDTVPPTLQIVSPGSTIVSTMAAAFSFTGTASDNVGVAAVKWTTSSGDSGSASGTTAWSASVPLLVGTTVVTIRAYDAAGNSAWRAVTVVRH